MGAAQPKQFLELEGRRVIDWTLQSLAVEPRLAGIMLALPDAAVPPASPHPALRLQACQGGATRQQSVLNALLALETLGLDPATPVLVHDAARPLLSAADLAALIDHPAECAILAAPMADTVKRDDGAGRIARTVPRESLWRALTPQRAPLGLLRRALAEAQQAALALTDEAQALERLGVPVALVPGSALNFKLTTPDDLRLAAALLKQRAAAP